MNKSLYRKIVLILDTLTVGMLVYIIYSINAYDLAEHWPQLEYLIGCLLNTYVSGVFCSVIAVVLVYFVQLWYGKRQIKHDFRCQEIIKGIYRGIKYYEEIYQCAKELEAIEESEQSIEDYIYGSVDKGNYCYEFFKKHRLKIELSNYCFTNDNNQILFDSIQSCFFLNLNFKALGIMNHIKNRRPNLVNGFPKAKELFDQIKESNEVNEQVVREFGKVMCSYMLDLRFMWSYMKRLLDYLGFDPIYQEVYFGLFNKLYSLDEFIRLPTDEQNKKSRRVRWMAKKQIFYDQISDFWKK